MTSDSRAVYAGGAGDSLVTALAAGTGRTLWAHRLGAPAYAAAAAGDALYVIDADATVYAIQA
jgi:outer membrane protein assembly factor BamB